MTLLSRIAEQTGLNTLCNSAEVKGALLVCLDAHFPHYYIIPVAHQATHTDIWKLTGFDLQLPG